MPMSRHRRCHVPFDTLWRMRIDVPYSLLVREGDLAWSCGQCPLDRDGNVLAPFDLAAQTRHVAHFVEAILHKAEMTTASIGKLVVYHASQSVAEIARMRNILLQCFGDGPAIIPVGIPHFYYDGMLIEVDMHASRKKQRTISIADDNRGLTIRIVDGGEIVWVDVEVRKSGKVVPEVLATSLQMLFGQAFGPIDRHIPNLLAEHWFVGAHADAAIAMDAVAGMGLAVDRGAAFAVCLGDDILARGELTFVRGDLRSECKPDVSNRDGVSIYFGRLGRFFWAAGRCTFPRGSIVAETTEIMRRLDRTLAAHGVGFDAVVKASTHYVGGGSAEDLHENMAVRNAYYRHPGPASTGLPVHGFPYSGSTVNVDVLGVVSALPG